MSGESGHRLGRVLVTGASGFVGGWIVESMQLAGIPVRAAVRKWNNAVRLARRPTDMVACDIMSVEQIRAAMDGCDTVVHCAVGDAEVNERGTRNVLQVAAEQRTRRVVHLSSVAVYGKSNGVFDESSPRQADRNAYAASKIAAERVCEEYIARGLSVIGLRPSIIYGPFGETWTVSFARRLASGRWGTFGDQGLGQCNLVYITDVVQAVYRSLLSASAPSGFYNVNGAGSLTWNDYFVAFNRALGRPPLEPLATWRIVVKAQLLTPVRALARYAMTRFEPLVTRMHAKHPWAARSMGQTETSLKLTPTRDQIKLYSIRATFPIDKAQRELGYRPLVTADQGLKLSVDWIRQNGILYEGW